MLQKTTIFAFALLVFATPALTLAAQVVHDSFDTYAEGNLSEQNGGDNWTSPWLTDGDFQVQSDFAAQGNSAVRIVTNQFNESSAIRQFTPTTKGKIHFSMAKDSGSQAPNFIVQSGETVAMLLFIGSDAQQTRAWYIREGANQIEIAPYALGNFDSVDIQFDLNRNRYRASVNGDRHTKWFNLVNSVNSVDTVRLHNAVSDSGVSNLYWDDIKIK
jgi:hypothetical protein